jgi:hypothetical protein
LSRNPLTSVEQLKNRKVYVASSASFGLADLLAMSSSEETVKSLQDKWNTLDFDEGMGGTPRDFLEVCLPAVNNRFYGVSYTKQISSCSKRLLCHGEPFVWS